MARAPKPLGWAPKAKEDLREIWRHFVNVASPEIADNLLREIGRASERLAKHPLSGRPRDEIISGLRSILVHPYSVIYRVTDSCVEVVRVLHERRDFAGAFAKERG